MNPALRYLLIIVVIAAIAGVLWYRHVKARTPDQVARAAARSDKRKARRIAAMPLEVRPSKGVLYTGWVLVLGGFFASFAAFVNWMLQNRLPVQLAFAGVILLGILILIYYARTSVEVRGDVLVQRRMFHRARAIPFSAITATEVVERAGHTIVHVEVAGGKPLVLNLTKNVKRAEWLKLLD